MGQHPLLDRRRFLLGAAPGVTIAALDVGACSRSNDHVHPSTYTPTYFRAAEWAFINAAVGRLIPAEGAGPGAGCRLRPPFRRRSRSSHRELPTESGSVISSGPLAKSAGSRGCRHAPPIH